MLASFLKLVSILWAHRAIIVAAIPLVLKAKETYQANADKKAWVVQQLEQVKQFTPQAIDDGIDATVHLLKLGGLL